jgi:hypothetical protein
MLERYDVNMFATFRNIAIIIPTVEQTRPAAQVLS